MCSSIALVVILGLAALAPLSEQKTECEPTSVACLCGEFHTIVRHQKVSTKSVKEATTGISKCKLEHDPYEVCLKMSCVLDEEIPEDENKEAMDFYYWYKDSPVKEISGSINSSVFTTMGVETDQTQNKTGSGVEKDETQKETGSTEGIENDETRKETETTEAEQHPAGVMTHAILSSQYPIKFTVRRRDLAEKHRQERSNQPCRVQPLENAEVTCYKWPNWINCNVNCIHGYGIQGPKKTVRKITANCRLSEDKWKPRGLEDCKPFMNCKPHLKSPGEMSCVELASEPHYCDISCLEYDDYEESKQQRYVCNQTYSSLPHCAALDDGMELIAQP